VIETSNVDVEGEPDATSASNSAMIRSSRSRAEF